MKAVNSDHKPLVMDVMLEIPPTKKKIELLDYKDTNSQMKFHEITCKTNIFSDSIDSMQSVSEQGNSWLRNVKAHCKRAFKTIRIRSQQIKPSKADRLIRQRIILLKKGDNLQAERLDVKIANMIFQENKTKALMFKKYMNQGETQPVSEMWKLKQSIFPKKNPTLPSSKFNRTGKLVSEPRELIKLLAKEYGQVRLRKRPVHPMHTPLRPTRERLLRLKLSISEKRKTPDFKMEDLDMVLKGLKTNKARDTEGLARTIFKTPVIGTNLKKSLLKLFNNMKSKGEIPEFMSRARVATIPKKGSKLNS